MGGGAGLTVPGRFRVATEKAVSGSRRRSSHHQNWLMLFFRFNTLHFLCSLNSIFSKSNFFGFDIKVENCPKAIMMKMMRLWLVS
jgi:hypothetical protein